MSAAMTKRGRLSVWVLVAAGLLLVAAANLHLVYVAVMSQPECIAHLRPGESSPANPGAFSAAKSSCTPR